MKKLKTVEKEDENILLAQWFVTILSGVACGGQGASCLQKKFWGKIGEVGLLVGKWGKEGKNVKAANLYKMTFHP